MSMQREFLKRWTDWDARPGMKETAVEFNDAVRELAELLDVAPAKLRDYLSDARRGGLNHIEALTAVLEALQEDPA